MNDAVFSRYVFVGTNNTITIMKSILIVLFTLASHALAAGEYVLLVRNAEFYTADNLTLQLKAGDCFPFIRWEPGQMRAVMNVRGIESRQVWDKVKVVAGSKEAEARCNAALLRLEQERTAVLAAKEKARQVEAEKMKRFEQYVEQQREVREQKEEKRQMNSIEAALWQIANQRR